MKNNLQQKQIIPAPTGWKVLTPCEDDDGSIEFLEFPVIAWEITSFPEGFFEMKAITTDLEGEGEWNYLESPEGMMQGRYGDIGLTRENLAECEKKRREEMSRLTAARSAKHELQQ